MKPAVQTTVSVALCSRDGVAYVGQQIASILSQTVPVDEIVVSDDDSADDTVAIIERALHDANAPVRLKVLHNRPPLGVTRNFEGAMLAATGATVALRRTSFERATPFPSAWPHDEWLAAVAASVGAVALVEHPLIRYRIHSQRGRHASAYGSGHVAEVRGARGERRTSCGTWCNRLASRTRDCSLRVTCPRERRMT